MDYSTKHMEHPMVGLHSRVPDRGPGRGISFIAIPPLSISGCQPPSLLLFQDSGVHCHRV